MGTQSAIDVLKGNLKISGADLVEKVQGAGEVFDGEPDGVKPDATLTMTDQTFIALVEKKTMPQTAFIMRKLKISGNVTKALKVVHVLEAARAPASKL